MSSCSSSYKTKAAPITIPKAPASTACCVGFGAAFEGFVVVGTFPPPAVLLVEVDVLPVEVEVLPVEVDVP